METVNDNIERCRVIRGFKELNSEGCMFFIEAGSEQVTRMTSTQLRWLTHKKDNGDCFTNAQRQAIEKIDRIANDRNSNAPTLRIKILLYADPRILNDEESKYIKQLIRCGGTEVYYLETREDQRLRISIQGKKLYLSMSERQDQEVHEGILYVSEKENSPLIQYFIDLFETNLRKAKKLKVKNNERIAFDDSLVDKFKRFCKTDKAIGTLWGILGIIATIMVAIYVSCHG